jgi:hypothetical protein
MSGHDDERDAEIEWPEPAEDPPLSPDEPLDKADEQALIPPAPVVPPLREP